MKKMPMRPEFEKDNLRYKLASEVENPFFVIVHAKGAYRDPVCQDKLSKLVISEIERIKARYNHVHVEELPLSVVPEGIPYDSTILVCGFYDRVCVEDERKTLQSAGYNFFVSREGTIDWG